MSGKIKIQKMTTKDHKALKEIIEHCKDIDRLLESLSSNAQVNITVLEGDVQVPFVYIGAYVDILQGLIDADV